MLCPSHPMLPKVVAVFRVGNFPQHCNYCCSALCKAEMPEASIFSFPARILSSCFFHYVIQPLGDARSPQNAPEGYWSYQSIEALMITRK